MKAFDEIFEDRTKYAMKLTTNEYQSEGAYPIIDQGQKMIAAYTDLEEGAFVDVPVIIFGDHTRIIKYIERPFFLGADGVKVLKSKMENANYRYLYYALRNAKIPDTGYNRHYKWLKRIQIRYIELEKQQKIVDILDKMESIIANRKYQLEEIDTLVKSRFVEMFGDVRKYVLMSDLCSIITDGTHQPPRFVQEGIPFIFVSNIAGDKLTYETEKFISQETYDELIKRTPIEIGDILLSTVGSYGHPAVVKSDKKFLFQRHIAYLKPKKDIVDSDYLHGALLMPDAQRQIEEGVKGIAQKTLNLSEIKKMTIPVPDMSGQKMFATFVTQTNKLKLEIQKSLDQTQTLMDSLMQEYFG